MKQDKKGYLLQTGSLERKSRVQRDKLSRKRYCKVSDFLSVVIQRNYYLMDY
jgi:hypothetical protein